MPLLGRYDCFLDPDDVGLSVLHAWTCGLVGHLNRTLPRDDYRADPDFVSEIGILEELRERPGPPTTATASAILHDCCQVLIHSWNPFRPCGVIAFVTPRIKADPVKRAGFIQRCLSHLSNAAGLVVIDSIAWRGDSPLAELAAALGFAVSLPSTAILSFRTAFRNKRLERDLWVSRMPPGELLPSVPLALRGGPVLDLALENTYAEAIRTCNL